MRFFIQLITKQSWLRFGIRDRLARWWHNPDTATPEAFEVPFFGYRYRGNFNTFIDWSVFYYGAYCKEELLLMRDALKNIEQPIIFDIGANVGHHTLFAASIASRVHSFEPYDLVAEQLWDKVTSNSIQHVTLHRFGLGNENQKLQFDAPTNCNTGTGKFVLDQTSKENTLVEHVLEVRRGDDVVRELAVKTIHYVKIDVEGFEVQVLKGLRGSLDRFRPFVFFEWNQTESGVAAFQSYFPEDYEFFAFEPTPAFLVFFCKQPFRLKRLMESEAKQGSLRQGGNFFARPVEKPTSLSFTD